MWHASNIDEFIDIEAHNMCWIENFSVLISITCEFILLSCSYIILYFIELVDWWIVNIIFVKDNFIPNGTFSRLLFLFLRPKLNSYLSNGIFLDRPMDLVIPSYILPYSMPLWNWYVPTRLFDIVLHHILYTIGVFFL